MDVQLRGESSSEPVNAAVCASSNTRESEYRKTCRGRMEQAGREQERSKDEALGVDVKQRRLRSETRSWRVGMIRSSGGVWQYEVHLLAAGCRSGVWQ